MHLLIALAIISIATPAAAAQNVETDPIQCWWRTSAGAVRVGEPFSLVLTCAIVENDAAKVIVDQSKLEASVIQLAPFEVTGGSHGADLRTDERRFFQYDSTSTPAISEWELNNGVIAPVSERYTEDK